MLEGRIRCEKHYNVHASGCPLCLIEERGKLRKENAELREKQYVYENTPFAHWVERAEKAENKLEEGRHLLKAVQMAYRKHNLMDDSIGWTELSDFLCDALCEAMGDDGFQKWLKSCGESATEKK